MMLHLTLKLGEKCCYFFKTNIKTMIVKLKIAGSGSYNYCTETYENVIYRDDSV